MIETTRMQNAMIFTFFILENIFFKVYAYLAQRYNKKYSANFGSYKGIVESDITPLQHTLTYNFETSHNTPGKFW